MKSNKGFKTVTGIILLIAMIGTPVAAGDLQHKLAEESTVEQILKRGVMRVGISTFVPWAMKDKTGKLIGFEIDENYTLLANQRIENVIQKNDTKAYFTKKIENGNLNLFYKS